MEFRREDYLGWRRDSRVESELAKKLRKEAEDERYRFIECFLGVSVDAALALANRCLRKREHFEAILRKGLKIADISSIGGWISCVAPRLGCKGILDVIESVSLSDAAAAKRAFWGMGEVLRDADRECNERAMMLLAKLKRGDPS